MKFQARVRVLGMKASKGKLEDGTPYDSTKVYVVGDLDASKGTMLGQCANELVFGLSGEIEGFRKQVFPFDADAELELVSNGKASKTVIRALKPAKA